jgi:hypothetical protein
MIISQKSLLGLPDYLDRVDARSLQASLARTWTQRWACHRRSWCRSWWAALVRPRGTGPDSVASYRLQPLARDHRPGAALTRGWSPEVPRAPEGRCALDLPGRACPTVRTVIRDGQLIPDRSGQRSRVGRGTDRSRCSI